MPLHELRTQVASVIKREVAYLKSSPKKRIAHFIKGFKLLDLFDKEGSMILKSFYFWARFVDDVIDGDRSHPLSKDKKFFIEDKRHFLEGVAQKKASFRETQDEQDLLIIYAHRAAKEFLEIDIIDSVKSIFETMEYDFQRSSAGSFPSIIELNAYFDKLDVTTVYETLRIMKEGGITKEDLEGLNQATRARYTIRDLIEDIKKKIFNISKEELMAHNIDSIDFVKFNNFKEALLHPGVRQWVQANLLKIQLGLRANKRTLANKKIQLKTRLALFICFKLPCIIFLFKWNPRFIFD